MRAGAPRALAGLSGGGRRAVHGALAAQALCDV